MARDFTREEIERQAIAAKSLIAEISSDDDELNHDMVEGETNLFEAIERALEEIQECEVIIAGVADMAKRLSDRKTRATKRAERLRGLIDQAFQMAELKSHVFPCATITTKAVPPKVIVSEESEIPSEFFKPQPPKLDMAALKDALKSGPVAGASLSNGGTTIQIRRA